LDIEIPFFLQIPRPQCIRKSETLSVILCVNIITKLISNSSQEILGSLFQHEIDSLDELNAELEGVALTQEQIQVNLIKLSVSLRDLLLATILLVYYSFYL
jgi:hypothetical protein